ncbi:hypothetical protein PENARI_c003G12220 [Penicillium arizonense]|uniref:Uncharacterized protein n=1 Tax=Penicillium arizonense TaxID=1835702 RepID=A0A1F5LT47_PENAI|nr:hypothetical protein PENARI_c003G12220 [Penicillium arizonense]OGE56378.1 hypothetical protein PENARI_c003G12220 [Penicillium arizonense]
MAAIASQVLPTTTKRDFTSFCDECNSAPRINQLLNWFESTARGQTGRTIKNPEVDKRLFDKALLEQNGERFAQFLEVFNTIKQSSLFVNHYYASIPYRIEENCRLGNAVIHYSQQVPSRPLLYRSVGTGDSSMARSVAEFSEGSVEALCCSPNEMSALNFAINGDPPTPPSSMGLSTFASGFDIIVEDTTFQMYSPNRDEQVGFVVQSLKEDGIFVFVEKFRHADIDEYERRELQKDYGFKARYFSSSEVAAKGKDVLVTMSQNQVTLDDMAAILQGYFQHCSITLNSGNFYTLVASNNPSLEMNNPVAENVLGTLGAVCWSIQLLPQIIINYRRHDTEGLQGSMMLLWASAGVPLGVYNIVEEFNIALRVQPQILTTLSLITWAQCLYYGKKYSIVKCSAAVTSLLLILGGIEVGLVFALRAAKDQGLEWPLILMAVLSACLLAAGVLRHYWDIYVHRTVRGISFIFVGIDAAGDLFSLVSVFY